MKRQRVFPGALAGCAVGIAVTHSWRWLAIWFFAIVAILCTWGAVSIARRFGNSAEQAVRKTLHMPPDHPERLTRRVSRKHRMLFAQLAGEAWPHSEYIHIVDEERQEQQRREES